MRSCCGCRSARTTSRSQRSDLAPAVIGPAPLVGAGPHCYSEGMTDDQQIAFHDLSPESFPFTIEFFRVDTLEVVHTIEVLGPGAVHVPPLANQLGVRVGVRMHFADGHSVEE